VVEDDEVDSGWEAEPDERPTAVPPAPDKEPEPPTKPRNPTPAVLRLDSASQFERPDPSAVISRRGRKSLLELADSVPAGEGDDLSLEPGSDALDLVAMEADRQTPIVSTPAPAAPPAAASSGRIVDPLQEMRERYSLGDYSGALVVAESILEDDPQHAEALKCEASCRQVLEQMYTTRIGPLERVPFVAVPQEQLRWLNLDHRAGFVLSHVDGNCSLEQILDVSGMPPLDALRILFELLQQRVIGFR
jgi:hypothetical protein